METAVLLARIQFALTIGYHFLFVPISLGLGLIMVLAARRYRRRGLETDRAGGRSVDTHVRRHLRRGRGHGSHHGVRLRHQLGGLLPVRGQRLRSAAGRRGHLRLLRGVELSGHRALRQAADLRRASTTSPPGWSLGRPLLSAFWILVANSWMHTPAGFKVEDGQAVLTNVWAAIFTTRWPRGSCTRVNATFMTGAFYRGGVAAHYLIKRRHLEFAKRALTTALIVGDHHFGGSALPRALAVARDHRPPAHEDGGHGGRLRDRLAQAPQHLRLGGRRIPNSR